ncbi:MAG: hypothetical protein MUC93_01395 [Bacteroidales bacterium]|jgi:hypothetical protein|nr:hypothetical protein [Bacteroidales bacterium]
MRNIFFILFLFFLPGMVSGQAPFPNKDEIKQFSESTTCVVLEADPFSAFNSYIKEAMTKYWKVTPYEFIDVNEFNIRRPKPGFSFIVLTETNFDKDKSNSVFNFINLLQGKDVDKLGDNPEICAVPLSYAGEDDLDYGYKLGVILEFMQKHAQLIMEDPSKTGRKYLKFYNENVPALMKKKILVKEEDLTPDIGTIERIRSIYSNDIEIVPEELIVKAIDGKTPDTVILHKVGPVGETKDRGYCFKMLIGTDDANMYYYNVHTIDKSNPNGLLPSDLKRLARFE